MSCGCMNKKLGSERERIRRLAKAFAQMEGILVAVYRNDDGTYGFCPTDNDITKPIIEYITPY